jgi:hypothetical protein
MIFLSRFFQLSRENIFLKWMTFKGMRDKAEESYRLFRRTGRGKEAKMVRLKLEEALFAKEHLFHDYESGFLQAYR